MRKTTPLSQRLEVFHSYVEKTDSCWNWKGSLTHNGYGQFHWYKRPVRVHRLQWELLNGPIPEGKFICHRCDNRKCLNPEHLFLGDSLTNIQDMDSKGRRSKLPSNWKGGISKEPGYKTKYWHANGGAEKRRAWRKKKRTIL